MVLMATLGQLSFNRIVNYLMTYPSIGKAVSTVLGVLETPTLEGMHFIDEHMFPGFYRKSLPFFLKFYGSRVIPLNKNLSTTLLVSPTEEIMNIVRRLSAVSIGYCYCRVKNHNCDNPVWTCLHVGTGKYLAELENEIPLRASSIEEVEKLLHKADKLGLVHQLITAPSNDYFYVICNCCPCCCTMLQAASALGPKRAAISSSFVAQQDKELCTDCGKCVERCYFNARRFVKEKLEYNSLNCAGCGLCVTFCPSGAIELIRR